MPKITTARQKALTGTWSGKCIQDQSTKRESQELTFKLELNAGRRRISGILYVEDTNDFQFSIEGAFYHNKYLRLNYTAHGATEDAIDFGSIFLVLGDFPNKMNGKLVGYGSISEAIISGTVEFIKPKEIKN